ncbi:MAG: SDR family oxidoreductase [Candidatus Theseobacter exili]|nr:SDR family oxidoreductase [Candidatus Theseobacter exili]
MKKDLRKILIIGASGFLGHALVQTLEKEFHIEGTHYSNPVKIGNIYSKKLDVMDEDSTNSLLNAINPDVVINCAVAGVDLCRQNPAKATGINAMFPEKLAEWCSISNAQMIHFSTDLVFDGINAPYDELSEAHPLSEYGKTKLIGEKSVLYRYPSALIFRLALLYGSEKGFISWLHKTLNSGKHASLFIDQFRTPLYVGDVCSIVCKALKPPFASGLYNLAGPDRINRMDIGKIFAKTYGFSLDMLKAEEMSKRKHYEPRPLDASMRSEKSQKRFSIQFHNIRNGIKAMAKADPLFKENRCIRSLQIQVKLALQMIAGGKLSQNEAYRQIDLVKKNALNMFPKKGTTFDLIYRPRFIRLIEEVYGKHNE